MQENKHTLQLKSLTLEAVMKLLFIANVMLWGSFGIFIGLAALFGFGTVKWNETVITGFGGFIIGLAIAAIFCLIATAITGLLSYLGIRVYSALRPNASLSYLESDSK